MNQIFKINLHISEAESSELIIWQISGPSIGAIWLKKPLAAKLRKKVNKYASLGFGSYRHILNRIASKHSCRTESLM